MALLGDLEQASIRLLDIDPVLARLLPRSTAQPAGFFDSLSDFDLPCPFFFSISFLSFACFALLLPIRPSYLSFFGFARLSFFLSLGAGFSTKTGSG